jgi:hypothetical protein
LVKCAQTGKQLTVKVKDLAREDGEAFRESDFTNGASLMLERKGKSYPVRFLSHAGKFVCLDNVIVSIE